MTQENQQLIKEAVETLRQALERKSKELALEGATGQYQQHGLELTPEMTHEDIKELYAQLDDLSELEQKIKQKGKLEFGDRDVISYNNLRKSFMRDYLPTDEQFTHLLKDLRQHYESLLEEKEKDYQKRFKEELEGTIQDIIEQIP